MEALCCSRGRMKRRRWKSIYMFKHDQSRHLHAARVFLLDCTALLLGNIQPRCIRFRIHSAMMPKQPSGSSGWCPDSRLGRVIRQVDYGFIDISSGSVGGLARTGHRSVTRSFGDFTGSSVCWRKGGERIRMRPLSLSSTLRIGSGEFEKSGAQI